MCSASLLFTDVLINLCHNFGDFFFSDVSLDLEELGLDDQLRQMSKTPDEPIFDYDTVQTRMPVVGVVRPGELFAVLGGLKVRLPAGGSKLPLALPSKFLSTGVAAAPPAGVQGSLKLRLLKNVSVWMLTQLT